MGEATLLLDDLDGARQFYCSATASSGNFPARLGATRRQARMILGKLGYPRTLLDDCIRLPTVVVFSGHMVDRNDRPTPRFPANIVPPVADEIAAQLDEMDAQIGYSSAACGSDILFVEQLLARKRKNRQVEANLCLALPPEEFLKASVTHGDSKHEWLERFYRLQKRARSVKIFGLAGSDPVGELFHFANHCICGTAIIRASHLGTKPEALAVWDGRKEGDPGGTSSMLQIWEKLGFKPRVIRIDKILKQHGHSVIGPGPSLQARQKRSAGLESFRQHMVGMLFADVKGYSRIPDRLIPEFIRHWFGMAGRLLQKYSEHVLVKNTWGDALYIVFNDIQAAGQFAMELKHKARQIRGKPEDLPEDIGLRISLHAGPAYKFTDPVTAKANYSGAHVSWTARIEPITPPGEVYASEPFAAIAAVEGARGFRCEYVGMTSLAKGYGTFATYHVR